jgi:curved DNA-binding protein CbpA
MRPLAEQDHYEVLEVARDASFEDVERAYRVAQATYAEDSLALYSVFGGEDAEVLRERIELAWSVLSDVERRRAYDVLLARGGASPQATPVGFRERFSAGGFEDEPTPAPRASAPPKPLAPLSPLRAPERLRPLAVEALEPVDAHEDLSDGELDGAALRRARTRRGLDLEQIAGVTKINPMYLRCLEEERFEDLPSPVYVRGFLVSYLRCCGIDPASAVPGFMARYETIRSAGKKARPPGRP